MGGYWKRRLYFSTCCVKRRLELEDWQNVMLMAELHGVKRKVRSERARELLANFDLWERRDQRGRALSKGLKQRLMICMALVSEPQILFPDEPTSSLDSGVAKKLLSLIIVGVVAVIGMQLVPVNFKGIRFVNREQTHIVNNTLLLDLKFSCPILTEWKACGLAVW